MAKYKFSITKEPLTGYRTHHPGSSEHCFNCVQFVKEESGCKGPKMMELSKLPRLANGHVEVHPVAYCNFWKKE